MSQQAAPTKIWLGVCVLAGIATGREYFARGHRGGAALWALIALVFAVQLLRDRISFSLRKALTLALLLGLVAVSVGGSVVWYEARNYANMAVTSYTALAFAGVAIWVATAWRPPTTVMSPVRFQRTAVVLWMLAGYVLLYGFSLQSAGYLPIAALAWATSAVSAAAGVGVFILDRRLRRQGEIAQRLGFDDLLAYYEARSREGVSLDQMAIETGMKPTELQRAANTWKEFRLRKTRIWV